MSAAKCIVFYSTNMNLLFYPDHRNIVEIEYSEIADTWMKFDQRRIATQNMPHKHVSYAALNIWFAHKNLRTPQNTTSWKQVGSRAQKESDTLFYMTSTSRICQNCVPDVECWIGWFNVLQCTLNVWISRKPYSVPLFRTHRKMRIAIQYL